MFKDFFSKRNKYVTVKRDKRGKIKKKQEPKQNRNNVPTKNRGKEGDQLWTKCGDCQEIIFNKKLKENQMVCPVCDNHFRISAKDRIKGFLDNDSFIELFQEVTSADPLNFEGYQEKLDKARKKSGLNEAVVTGRGELNGVPIAVGIMDFSFAGGSMGSAVGEKIASLIEYALSKRLPLIIFSTAGGARMQEGMLSLMQMAKTSAALARFDEAGLLYISVLTHPTSGGVTASYAMLGDINLAEPNALVAFAGPRVIKQTINQELPEGFQRSEFLLEHGMVDRVVHRHQLRNEIKRILNMHRLVGEVS